MFREIAQRVLHRWQEEGLHPQSPVPVEEIITKLQDIGVTPNPEVLDVYSHLNGLDDTEMDLELFAFWSIKKIRLENRRNSEMVAFADFLIDSHRYAFRIEPDGVIGIYVDYGKNEKVRIADSFSEFFELYLTDTAKLFQ